MDPAALSWLLRVQETEVILSGCRNTHRWYDNKQRRLRLRIIIIILNVTSQALLKSRQAEYELQVSNRSRTEAQVEAAEVAEVGRTAGLRAEGKA